jgi:peptidoglycan hydrolase-like protein with peptidoglycan-binding domain
MDSWMRAGFFPCRNPLPSTRLQGKVRIKSRQREGAIRLLSVRASLALVFSAALVVAPQAARAAAPASASVAHRPAASGHKKTLNKVSRKSHKLHGQQAIEPARVTEIQQALIREHYLSGDATGKWDATTEAAMQKFQADQGWQTKLMPDSRALKKLGLGPDYSNAINAKNSSFGDPPPINTIPAAQAEGFAAAAGVKD